MLVEMSIGECLCRPFNNASKEFIESNKSFDVFLEPSIMGLMTHQAYVVSKHILKRGRWCHFDLSDSFRTNVPAVHYPPYMKFNLHDEPFNDNNDSLGRVLPLFMFEDLNDVQMKSVLVTSLTHVSETSLNASAMLAIVASKLFHDTSIDESAQLMSQFIAQPQQEDPKDAGNTLAGVFYNLLSHKDVIELLDFAMSSGGDAGTLGSLSLGLASLRPDHYDFSNLNESLFDNLLDAHVLDTVDDEIMQLLDEE